jgi:hypothetical protein
MDCTHLVESYDTPAGCFTDSGARKPVPHCQKLESVLWLVVQFLDLIRNFFL